MAERVSGGLRARRGIGASSAHTRIYGLDFERSRIAQR
jgi:hypothetical protein